jgi:hypothetical protein
MMKLNKKQKEKVLAWVGEGLQSDEMNARAARCRPPFSVSRQQVDFYRDSRGVALDELREASESDALRTGLALKEKRVEALNELAERLKTDLLGGLLWLKREKALGSGALTKFVTEKHFNHAEINALRALLDDIAKEVGERSHGGGRDEDEEETGEVTVTVRYEEKPKQAETED